MKTICTAIALSLFSTLIADCCPPMQPAPQPCCPVIQKCCPKTYSCCDVTFELFGQWLFLQPNGSSIYYGVEAFPFDTAIAVPEVSPNWQVFEIDPSYTSGFEVGTKFFFPKNDMNLEINWERLHTQDKESMDVTPGAPGTGNMVGPFFDIGPNSAVYKRANGKAVFHFDAVNVIVGKTVCFINDLTTRFYTGAGFVRIKQTIFSQFFNDAASTSRTVFAPSTFTGAGPEFGVDFDYRLCGCFYFTGSTSTGLYMGQSKNHTTYKSTSPLLSELSIPQPNIQRTTVPNRSQLIPGFEEKLGFAYEASYHSCKLIFAAGYQFQIYLDAVQSVDMTSPQVLPSVLPGTAVNAGVYAVGFERTLSNFILTGPYVSIKIDF